LYSKSDSDPFSGEGLANRYSLTQMDLNGDGMRLAIAGEIDIANVEAFTDELRSLCEGANGQVTLDLRDCRFIDSTGIRALMALAQERQARRRTLKLAGLRGEPLRVLEVSGVLDSGLFVNS
jgi:anti-anti-sigma factor